MSEEKKKQSLETVTAARRHQQRDNVAGHDKLPVGRGRGLDIKHGDGVLRGSREHR